MNARPLQLRDACGAPGAGGGRDPPSGWATRWKAAGAAGRGELSLADLSSQSRRRGRELLLLLLRALPQQRPRRCSRGGFFLASLPSRRSHPKAQGRRPRKPAWPQGAPPVSKNRPRMLPRRSPWLAIADRQPINRCGEASGDIGGPARPVAPGRTGGEVGRTEPLRDGTVARRDGPRQAGMFTASGTEKPPSGLPPSRSTPRGQSNAEK